MTKTIAAFKLTCTILLISILPNANIWAKTAASSLDEYLSAIESFQAKFIQRLKDMEGESIQSSSGYFYMLRPGKFHWETLTPNKQWLIIKENKIWFYDKELNQLTIQPVTNQIAPAFLLFTDTNQLSKQFHISYQRTSYRDEYFSLHPKHSTFSKMQLRFLNGKLYQLCFLDNLNQANEIIFSEAIYNKALPKEAFDVTVAKEVDILDQTQ